MIRRVVADSNKMQEVLEELRQIMASLCISCLQCGFPMIPKYKRCPYCHADIGKKGGRNAEGGRE